MIFFLFFFQEKFQNLFRLKFTFSRFDFFNFSKFISFQVNSTIEQLNCLGQEERDRLPVSKVVFCFESCHFLCHCVH